MQVNGAAPMYGSQYTSGSQPVTYVPGAASPYASTDQFTPQSNTGSGGGFLGSLQKKQYVTRTSVMTGLAGAGIGFLVGGPVGAVVGGVIGLLLSVLSNIFKGGANKSAQPSQQNQLYASPVPQGSYQQYNTSDDYYKRMQQQQIQQNFNR